MVKVAFIGAGSVEFTRNVVTDLCAFSELHGALELSFHDIDATRLGYAEALARRISDQTGAAARVTSSLDRLTAVDGADYVINAVQVGGYAATRADFDIPASFGVRQTIGDTIGIGGISRGLRTLPVAIGIGEDLAKVAPEAYLLNYSNPMAMLPWGVYAGTPFERVVGLCHSVRDTHAFLAGLLGHGAQDVDFVTAGFNHQAFVLKFERDGRDLYPALREVIDSDPELQRRVRVEMFRHLGYFPTESSEHSAEYVPWFMGHDSEIERFRIFVGDYLQRSERTSTSTRPLAVSSRTTRRWLSAPTSEMASEIIYAQQTGTPERALRERPQRRVHRQPASRLLRRGACPRRPRRCPPPGRRRPPSPPRSTQPDFPQRRGAHRPRSAGERPRARLPRRSAGSEHCGDAHHAGDPGDVR